MAPDETPKRPQLDRLAIIAGLLASLAALVQFLAWLWGAL